MVNAVAGTRGGVSAVVTAALARYLEKPIHTIFQVSTSGALVAGVYESEVSVRTLLEHGDFGLVSLHSDYDSLIWGSRRAAGSG